MNYKGKMWMVVVLFLFQYSIAFPNFFRHPPFSIKDWGSAVDSSGRFLSTGVLQDDVAARGAAPDVIPHLWPFLLCFYDWDMDVVQRQRVYELKSQEYEEMKSSWKMSSRISQWRYHTVEGVSYHQLNDVIAKDVVRTDRLIPFFEANQVRDHSELARSNRYLQLYNVLMTYCRVHKKVNYIQGMSVLASTILYVTKDETMTFWGFSYLMENMPYFQEKDFIEAIRIGVWKKVDELLSFADPELHQHLSKHSQRFDQMALFIQWFTVLFRYQLPIDTAVQLWTRILAHSWAFGYIPFVATSMILMQRKNLIEKRDHGEILGMLNRSQPKLSVDQLWHLSEKLLKQFSWQLRKNKKSFHNHFNTNDFHI